MDRNEKFLKSLSQNEFDTLAEIIFLIKADRLNTLDVKKLKGNKNTYRVRAGRIRIIFSKTGTDIHIKEIARRTEKTYRGY